ncbi:hypothetical protein BDP55DRAFT_507647, partial [Colletotrichum godetiae]
MANLSFALLKIGAFDQAESPGKSALDERENSLGKDHPDTNMSMSNLAMIYNAQFKRVEAAGLMSEAAQRSSNKLGDEHPITLLCVFNLAVIRCDQGHKGDAMRVWTTILPKMRAALGAGHESTV